MVPQPRNALFGSFHADIVVVGFATIHTFFGTRLIVPLDPASPNHQHITYTEIYLLVCGDLLEILVSNTMLACSRILDALLLCPACVVEKNTSADDASFLEPFYLYISLLSRLICDNSIDYTHPEYHYEDFCLVR